MGDGQDVDLFEGSAMSGGEISDAPWVGDEVYRVICREMCSHRNGRKNVPTRATRREQEPPWGRFGSDVRLSHACIFLSVEG